MTLNLEGVRKLVDMAYVYHAYQAFGEDGTLAITALLDTVKSLFQRCSPEQIPGTITVVRAAQSDPAAPLLRSIGSPVRGNDHSHVGAQIRSGTSTANCFVEVASDGSIFFIGHVESFDLRSLAQSAVIYHFDGNHERILVKDHNVVVPRLAPSIISNFAVPTLSSLEDALRRYAEEFARHSVCRILADVWEGGVDGPRLVLVNRPEAKMRDSLCQAIQLLTRDTSVRPEQNTDETKPVDIRVEWFASSDSAIIEVKWLGRSTAISRKSMSSETYTDYGPRRAQEGADQLADYLDREVRHSKHAARGYLVVFDARRSKVQGAGDKLKKEDAIHFRSEELQYDPDHASSRSDFAPPVRMYLEPREFHFLAD